MVLKDTATKNQQAVVDELRRLVATKIAKYAVPEHFLVNEVAFEVHYYSDRISVYIGGFILLTQQFNNVCVRSLDVYHCLGICYTDGLEIYLFCQL